MFREHQNSIYISKGSCDIEDWSIDNSDMYTCKSEAMALKITQQHLIKQYIYLYQVQFSLILSPLGHLRADQTYNNTIIQ